MLTDVDRASDIAQETFLQLTKDAGTVTGSLPGWLHRVATHKAIDQIRRDATRKHREAEYVAGAAPGGDRMEGHLTLRGRGTATCWTLSCGTF